MVLLTCRGTLVSKLFARGAKVLRSEPLQAAGVELGKVGQIRRPP
jgi:hypothetical protein